jgi:hypothetical protein
MRGLASLALGLTIAVALPAAASAATPKRYAGTVAFKQALNGYKIDGWDECHSQPNSCGAERFSKATYTQKFSKLRFKRKAHPDQGLRAEYDLASGKVNIGGGVFETIYSKDGDGTSHTCVWHFKVHSVGKPTGTLRIAQGPHPPAYLELDWTSVAKVVNTSGDCSKAGPPPEPEEVEMSDLSQGRYSGRHKRLKFHTKDHVDPGPNFGGGTDTSSGTLRPKG